MTHTDERFLPDQNANVQMSDMDLRDYFAGQAVTGMIATAAAPCMTSLSGTENCMAKAAYRLADAMIEARKEPRT
ncbi:MAG: hypothetical protein ABJ360_22370 [Roseobacter sp.]